MADYNLGTVQGTIEITYNGSGVEEANTDVAALSSNMEDSGESAGDVMDTVADKLLTFGAAGVAGFGLAAKTAADFQQQMSEVGAVSGATAEQMTQLTDKARQIGKDTSFSATEASTAMAELVKAGVSIPDVMNGAADATVALAAAGGTALPTAAEIAANSLNIFNLKGQDMGHVADVIAGAANASAISVEDFGQSIAQSGVVAAQYGLTIDDTATAIVALGNAGIKGGDAGTSLKTMLSNLQPSTKQQVGLFDELGITTDGMSNKFFDAEGNMKSMAEVSGILGDAVNGMGQDQKMATLEMMFGSDAIRAAAVMAETGADGFKELTTQMLSVTAADVAAQRLDNFKGRLDNAMGGLEDVGITIGNIVLPTFEKLVAIVGQATDWFSKLAPETQNMIVMGAMGAAGAALLVGGLTKAVFAIQGFVSGAKVLATALKIGPLFSAIGSGAGAAAGGISSAASKMATGMSGLVTNFKNGMMGVDAASGTVGGKLGKAFDSAHTAISAKMTQIATAVRTGVAKAATAVAQMATAAAQYVLHWVKMAAAATANAAKMAAAWVLGVISQAAKAAASMAVTAALFIAKWVMMSAAAMVNAAKMAASWLIAMGPIGLIIAAVVALVALIIMNWDRIKAAAVAVWGWLWPYIKATWDAIVAAAAAIWNGIKAVIEGVWNGIKMAAMLIWEGIKLYFQTWWLVVSTIFTTAVNVIKMVLQAAWAVIQAVTSAVWNAIVMVITTVWNVIKAVVTGAIDGVRTAISTAWEFISSVTSAVWNAISSVISSVWNTIVSVVTSAMSNVQSFISSAWEAIKSAVSSAISAVVEVISSGFNNAVSFVTELPGRFMSALGNLGTLLMDSGRALVRGFIDGIKAMIGAVVDAAKSVVSAARDLFPFSPAKTGPFSGKGWVLYSGEAVGDAFAQGMLNKKDDVSAAAEEVAAAASDPFANAWDNTMKSAGDAVVGIARALGMEVQPIIKDATSTDGAGAAGAAGAGTGASGETKVTPDDIVQMASSVLGLFDTIEQGLTGVKDLATLLIRGVSGTADIDRIISGVSSLIGTVSSVASTIGQVVDGVAKIAAVAGAIIPGLGQATAAISALTGGLGSVQSAISLVQQGFKIIGRITGGLLSGLAGGSEGDLFGRVRTLLDTNDQTIKRWSDANANDKRSTSYGKSDTNTTTNTGVQNLNIYQGPGVDPYRMVDEAMFAVQAAGVGVYA